MISEILEQLSTQAGEILTVKAANRNLARPSLKSVPPSILTPPLEAFMPGALGNFPYYWQNPSNLKFNHLTYNWISANLKADASPVQLDQSFTNYYIEALSAVSYQLSNADKAALNTAQQNAVNEQMALLNAWQSAYGSFPPVLPGTAPIDAIINTIATTWASPPTTWAAIQTASNLSALLNNTPPSGKTILPVLTDYLNALGSSISLQNAVTMNAGYLAQALASVQNPLSSNGGLATDDGHTNPAYIVSTPLADILKGLQDTSSRVTLNMSVSGSTSNGYTVSVNSSSPFNVPGSNFLSIFAEDNSDFFKTLIVASSAAVPVQMTFTGVTMVNYGPVSYNMANGQNWFWTKPITDSIKNGSADVTGFKFSPVPQIDFSSKGPFGYLTGVAISNYPTMNITVAGGSGVDTQTLAKTLQQMTPFKVSFLGVPLGTYSHSQSINTSSTTEIISLTPPPGLFAATGVNSVGWVLGVETNYPALS